MTEKDNQSEVANLLQQIDAEYTSAMRAVRSFAYGTTQHKFITARMEAMRVLQEMLNDRVGEGEATRLVAEQLDKCSEKEEGKPEETIYLRYVNSLDGVRWLGIDQPGENLYYLREGVQQELLDKGILKPMSALTPAVLHGHVPKSYIQDFYAKGKENS